MAACFNERFRFIFRLSRNGTIYFNSSGDRGADTEIPRDPVKLREGVGGRVPRSDGAEGSRQGGLRALFLVLQNPTFPLPPSRSFPAAVPEHAAAAPEAASAPQLLAASQFLVADPSSVTGLVGSYLGTRSRVTLPARPLGWGLQPPTLRAPRWRPRVWPGVPGRARAHERGRRKGAAG